MDVLNKLFEKHFHAPAERIQQLQGDLGGSGRKIIRLSRGNQSSIGILYDVREENAAFLAFSRHFRRHGLPVPEIYEEDLDRGAYIEQDLGDTTLFDFLSLNRSGDPSLPPWWSITARSLRSCPAFKWRPGATWTTPSATARQLRPPVHQLGPQLFQILFPALGRDSLQRTGARRRFSTG